MCCSSKNTLLMTSQLMRPYVLYHSPHMASLSQILIALTTPNLKNTVKYFKEKETSGELGNNIIQRYLLRAFM